MYPVLDIENCRLCPRTCSINRARGELGYCNCDSNPLVSSVFLHKGEEPVISGKKGICNVFFAHCNMQCVFCQNYQISNNRANGINWLQSYDEIIVAIIEKLNLGVDLLGFVSPSHQAHQMVEIIKRLNSHGHFPKIVYNTNLYDNADTLKRLEGIVDIYLPDFKYYDSNIGVKLSNAPNYFEVASRAFREIYRQKGSTLILNDEGVAESGIIVRHLVIPGYVDDSIKILEFLGQEYSNKLHISLMSQYFPPENLDNRSPINRLVRQNEYSSVVKKLEELGFRGWVQELASSEYYRPDFSDTIPFK